MCFRRASEEKPKNDGEDDRFMQTYVLIVINPTPYLDTYQRVMQQIKKMKAKGEPPHG